MTAEQQTEQDARPMTLDELTDDGRYSVEQYGGIAFYFYGRETEADEDTEWTGIEQETGRALLVMVGDDRRFSIDPADIRPLSEDAFCSSCGQIGCAW